MEPKRTTKTDHDWGLHPKVLGGAAADDGAKGAGGQGGPRPQRDVETITVGRRRTAELLASDDEQALPERLGRFVVLRRLGSGGMGTVLEAYDETLDRKVAVKQLHRDTVGDDDAAWPRQQRLLREAQALARLSHPNVVQVYDAGEHEGRLYIAMELVAGQTLWEWQRTPHAWPEVLRAYLGAAQGLAAAHAEGIVHRDFKPTNCLIDAQGRVKVLDFGLARGVDEWLDQSGGASSGASGGRASRRSDDAVGTVGARASRRSEEAAGSAGRGTLEPSDASVAAQSSGAALSALSLQLTRTGAMLGTPAYMAPEQASGMPADARSDQFSFCVALCEALYGERPLSGNPGLALLGGQVPRLPSKPPRGSGRGRGAAVPKAVPKWLRKALLRGLSLNKHDRFASMDELIAALQQGQRRRRWLGVAVVGVGVVLAGTAAAALRQTPCEGLRQASMPGWTHDERAAVERALSAAKVEHAWEATATGLDDYARAWVDARAQACEATHVQRVAGEELLELRMACLERHAVRAQAAVGLLSQADDGVAARAAQVVRSLPPIEPCLDAEALRGGPGPLPPHLRAPAAEIRALVARSWAFDAAGRAAQGLEAAEDAVARAEPLGPEGEPLLAEALHNRGRLYRAARRLHDARRDLEQVLQQAEHVGDRALALDALHELLLVAHDDADRSAFGAWLAMTRGKLRRLPQQPRSQAQLRTLEGLQALQQGELVAAAEAFDAAARLYGELGEGAALDLGRALLQLGVAEGRQGHETEADDAFEAARLVAERAGLLPLLAEVHHERGRLAFDRGRPEVAEPWLRRALELREAIDGPTAPVTIPTRVPLAMLLQQRGELQAAMAMAEAARRSLGPGVPASSHAQVMSLLARFHRQQGDWEAALDDYQRVEEALAQSPTPEPVELAMLHSNVADCLRMMGRLDAARTRYERALEGLRVHAAADDYRRVYPLFGLGSLLAAQRDPRGATSLLRRALAIQEATPKDLDMGAILRWELGRVVLEDAAASEHERAEALALVRAASEQFQAWDDAPMVAEIAAFLDRCGPRCAERPGATIP